MTFITLSKYSNHYRTSWGKWRGSCEGIFKWKINRKRLL